MYNSNVGGFGSIGTGIVILPNTGGNDLLLLIALISIGIGSVIVLSTVARSIAKKIYK